MTSLIPNNFSAVAIQLANRIDLRRLTAASQLSALPTTYRVGDGIAVLFRYGAVVFFSVGDDVRERFVADVLLPVADQPLPQVEREEVQVRVATDCAEGIGGGRVNLTSTSLDRLQLLAVVLAKSVLLSSYETRIRLTFDLVEPIARALAHTRVAGARGKALLKTIGQSLLIEHAMIGRAEVGEKPELLWERSELEGLYRLLEDEFEIRERDIALSRKLDLLSRTAQTALELLHNRRSLRVEWYIVILIVAEILLTLFELFVLKH